MANPLICVFNPVTSFIDEIQSVSSGPASNGIPIVTNINGVIDSSLIGIGSIATAGQSLSAGTLVNLYASGGTLHAQVASAQNGGGSPPAGPYPLQAEGFAATAATVGSPLTISFFGTFKYIDGNSEFNAGSIGSEVYLSDRGDGSPTLTPPSGGGELEQSVGYVVAFVSPNVVTINFASGFQDFTHISGVNPITKGGTGATTSAQALLNLINNPATTGQALVFNGTNWVPGSAVTPFTDITSGTNTVAAMIVGTGASLAVSGSGTIAATSVPFAGVTSGSNTTAALTVGSGASIIVAGTGIVTATQLATTGSPVIINTNAPSGANQTLISTSTTNATWQTAAVPGSPSTSVQYNNSGVFAGSANFEWINASNALNITGVLGLGDGSQAPGKIDAQATNAWEGGNPGVGGTSVFDTSTTITAVPTDVPMVAARSAGITYAPSADAHTIDFFGEFTSVLVPGTNAQQIFDVYGAGLFLEYDNTSTTTNNIFVEGTIAQALYNTSSGTGTIDTLICYDATAAARGNGSVNTAIIGINAVAFMQSSGSVPTVKGMNISSGATTGTVTNDYSIFIGSPDIGGTVAHHYGLWIADQTTLGPDPWSIWTNGGKHHFGGNIDTTGLVTTYNNIATVDNGVPAEYAHVDALTQAASIATATLYAVPASGAGMYRISYYLKVTQAATTSSSVTLALTYTDRDDSTVLTFVTASPLNATDETGVISGQMIVDAKLSTNLQYATTYASVGGTPMQYKLRIKVEAL